MSQRRASMRFHRVRRRDVVPAESLAGLRFLQHQGEPWWRRSPFGWRAKTDDGLAGDHGGLVCVLRRWRPLPFPSLAIDGLTFHWRRRIGRADRSIDMLHLRRRDAVVRPTTHEMGELRFPPGDGSWKCLPSGSRRQPTHIFDDEVIAETALRWRSAMASPGIGKALSQGAGGGFNAWAWPYSGGPRFLEPNWRKF